MKLLSDNHQLRTGNLYVIRSFIRYFCHGAWNLMKIPEVLLIPVTPIQTLTNLKVLIVRRRRKIWWILKFRPLLPPTKYFILIVLRISEIRWFSPIHKTYESYYWHLKPPSSARKIFKCSRTDLILIISLGSHI